jgi:mannitol-1-phosphate 5-dehydrogenase
MADNHPKIVLFGAGNIGRSFIGRVFSEAGYSVVFVDIDSRLVQGLNKRREYRVIVKGGAVLDETVVVKNVRAVSGLNGEAVVQEIVDADIIATSVGAGALDKVLPVIGRGLTARWTAAPGNSIDIIIAENIREGARIFREGLAKAVPEDFPLEDFVGLAETSIGKMVPIMRKEDVAKDPLWVFSEPYNRLIIDGKALKRPLPGSKSIQLVDDIEAYVDRKLFIHNLGHAATAYFGFLRYPERTRLYQVLEDLELVERVRSCMKESAAALLATYPKAFTRGDLDDHIEDLIGRFRNVALGDTVFRVGRDLTRKLGREDRVIGAMRLCRRHGVEYPAIAKTAAAALYFKPVDDEGAPFPADVAFFEKLDTGGLERIFTEVCRFDLRDPDEKAMADDIANYYRAYGDGDRVS